ncbi:hypothetical protein D1007_13015 [Hordeum vulgare]|nr:hypothetical protein D1007_13015 [Hordeum vulgare]
MADTTRGDGPGFSTENSRGRDYGERHHGNGSHHIPQPLTKQQWEELQRRSEQALRTPITVNALEEIELENACQGTLAECERLEQLQQSLNAWATRDLPGSSRN